MAQGPASLATAAEACPVCRAAPEPFLSAEACDYWACRHCGVRFLDPRQRPSREQERTHYLHHENDPGDPRYRRFLSKLVDPLLSRVPARSTGLDFGCGPGSGVAAMLLEAGHKVALYDPFFAPDAAVLARSYDFVACTESAEHFHNPDEEFSRLMGLVRPGGWLAVMTCFQTDDARFADWHYRKDPTHVVFYREETFRYLAGRAGWLVEVPAKDVALMRRPAAPGADR